MEIGLKQIRRGLFEKIESIDSAKKLFDIQLEIAQEIIRTEKAYSENKEIDFKEHIQQLRLYADGIAWTCLHSFSIRQLSKNPSPPQALYNQLGFENTLEVARKYAEQGLPVIISDITNCIKIGDVIICSDPEQPKIVEAKSGKPNKFNMNRGRALRQLSRIIGTMNYLEKGVAKVFGEEKPRLTIETKTNIEYNWEFVQHAVDQVLSGSEYSVVSVSESELIFAFRNDESISEKMVMEEIHKLIVEFEIPEFGCHLTPMEDPTPLVPPPSFWDISFEARFALMEGDVVLMHVLDVNAFTKIQTPIGSVTEILFDGKFLSDNCFSVEVMGEKLNISSRFLDNVKYGFATIQSICNQMLEFGQGTLHIGEKETELVKTDTQKKPEVLFYETLDEALNDFENHKEGEGKYVMLPESVITELYLRKDEMAKRLHELTGNSDPHEEEE